MLPFRLFAITVSVLVATALANAQTTSPAVTTLYDFQGNAAGDGEYPAAALVKGSGGVLYGSTCNGGSNQALGAGTVYSLTPPGGTSTTWTETVLYAFNVKNGSCPNQIIIGAGGVIYGTTYQGGTSNDGVVFSLSPPVTSGAPWTENILYSFQGFSDGYWPTSGVVMGPKGVLFGSTGSGGTGMAGTIYSLTPPATSGGSWSKTILHNFTGGSDGDAPSGLTLGKNGVLYGTAQIGGSTNNGLVFAMIPPASAGGPWTESVLYNFGVSDGSNPKAGVVIGSGGVLYGTTYFGPTSSTPGTVFSLRPPAMAGGAWTESLLHVFNGSDGANLTTPLAIGAGGVLYGTSAIGGTSSPACSLGCGTLFSLTPPTTTGGSWTFAVLDFPGTYPAGFPPSSAPLPVNGLLVGTARKGGPYICGLGGGCGTVYSVAP